MSTGELPSGKSTLSLRAALLAAAKLLGFAITIPGPLLLVRFLNQSEFGLYKQVFQILTDSLTLLGLHVAASAYYFMPRYPDKKAQVALNTLIFYGGVGAVVALAFAVYPRWITLVFKTDDLVPYVPMIGLAILLWLLSSLLEVVTVANSEIRAAAMFTIIVQLSKSALILGAGLIFRSINAIVIAAVVQGALQCLILFLYLRSRFGKFWRGFDPALFKAQLSNAIPFGLGALVYATQANLHNYFVSHYFSPADFAVYAVGCFELPLLNLLVDAVVSVLLPEIARREGLRDYEGIIGVWASAVRKLAFFFVPAYTLLFVLRREFITTLFTKNYEASVPIFAVNLLAILLFISVPTSIIRSFDDLKYFRLKLSIAMLPVAFIVLYVGVNAVGMIGAIGAFVLVQTVDLAIIVAKIGGRLQMSIRDLRRLAPILRTTLAATIAGTAAFLVKLALADANSLLKLAVCGTVFAVVHLTVAYAAGAVTDEEKIELRSAMVRFYRIGSTRLGFSRT